ncbi:hypothetical protein [Streptomyces gibsoniae]|uniref:Uncharacterized protein n=1 Tax=Streptomyces gibsoniae TaxID=3075529 RepID=A0ABU2U8X3_9ACTN|nr:hypothetical protein [Streptomyces sp. DSM 41699]MDT0469683.1 hypothetical protein [Streptomyces sp. DSM 41699]
MSDDLARQQAAAQMEAARQQAQADLIAAQEAASRLAETLAQAQQSGGAR